MTRIEEIQKLIDEEMGIDDYGSCDFQAGICYGVKHADKTMIEKVCEWLKENIWIYINYEGCSGEELENDIIEDFRKAMEE